MKINVSEIKNQLHADYQFSIEKSGKFAHHSIRILKQAIGHVQQDARLAGITFAIANIAFLEVAAKVAILLKDSLDLTDKTAILTILFPVLTGMNVVFYKVLNPSLSPLLATGVSVVSCAAYILFLKWRNK
jgi:hypothetical protein